MAEYAFPKTKLLAHLATVREEVMKFAGKKEHNPYLWLNEHVIPLEAILNGELPTTVEELQQLEAAVLAVKAEVPKI